MNVESRIFERLDTDRAYQKAEKMLRRAAIKPSDFRGKQRYDTAEIESHENEVERREKEFEKRNTPEQKEIKKLATIFEAVIHEHAELSDWFGPDAFTIKTSRFDDLENGVDTVVEFPESETAATYLALAIDVTFSGDTAEKFNRIKKEIERGELARVEYFVSEHTPHCRLEKVPRVVIGAEAGTVKTLSELWLEDDKRALGDHQIQFQILEEIIMQLKTFESYAERIQKKEAAQIYERERKLAEKIYQEKILRINDDGERDSIFFEIGNHLRAF